VHTSSKNSLQHALESVFCNRLMFIIAGGNFQKADPATTGNQYAYDDLDFGHANDTQGSGLPCSIGGGPVACTSTSSASVYRADAFQDEEIQYRMAR
jgi:hypothetical protein